MGDVGLAIEKYPQFVEATVALQRAQRDLANTVLRAPIAGTATQVASIQMGRFLTAGMAVFSIIGTDNVWVDANPKDRPHLRAPRPAGRHHRRHLSLARVARQGRSHQPRHGAQFAILPPQNAAGNWIKIVQRVPLRIEFEPGQDLRRLRSGMSATVEIDTGRRGRLARLLGSSAVAQDPDECRRRSAPRRPASLRRLMVTICVMMAVIMQVLDITIANVSSPTCRRAFPPPSIR